MVYGCQFSYLIHLEVPQPLAEINPLCMNRAKFCAQLDSLLEWDTQDFIPCVFKISLIIASSCARQVSGWIFGKITSLQEWFSIGIACPGRWWRHHPMKRSENKWMQHLMMWFGDHGVFSCRLDLMILELFFQPCFHDSLLDL